MLNLFAAHYILTEEELCVLRAVARLALENIPKIASAKGLEARSGSGGAKVSQAASSSVAKGYWPGYRTVLLR